MAKEESPRNVSREDDGIKDTTTSHNKMMGTLGQGKAVAESGIYETFGARLCTQLDIYYPMNWCYFGCLFSKIMVI